jgi:hypothetical protein
MAQFKRVWLPYDIEKVEDRRLISMETQHFIGYYPVEDEKTEKASTEIQNLITQGWRIVSTAPVTGSLNLLLDRSDDRYHTYTMGIEVFMVKE